MKNLTNTYEKAEELIGWDDVKIKKDEDGNPIVGLAKLL